MKINTISINDVNYPERLKSLHIQPETIYIRGSIPNYLIGVAIVGTRKPTSYGKQVTSDLAGGLASKGAIVISGLAHGIDGIAHDAALKAKGGTIAVLACGVDTIYPSAHHQLADRILNDNG
ncbi:MAG: DNA-processing protein DprA, partial [Candidatus Saccharimonadales bacterium]